MGLSFASAKDQLAVAAVVGFVALANYQLSELNKSVKDLTVTLRGTETQVNEHERRLNVQKDLITAQAVKIAEIGERLASLQVLIDRDPFARRK